MRCSSNCWPVPLMGKYRARRWGVRTIAIVGALSPLWCLAVSPATGALLVRPANRMIAGSGAGAIDGQSRVLGYASAGVVGGGATVPGAAIGGAAVPPPNSMVRAGAVPATANAAQNPAGVGGVVMGNGAAAPPNTNSSTPVPSIPSAGNTGNAGSVNQPQRSVGTSTATNRVTGLFQRPSVAAGSGPSATDSGASSATAASP